jgi:hypothetical protein
VSADKEKLQARIAALLAWEKRKRREATLLIALFYALLATLCAQPLLYRAADWTWAGLLAAFAALAAYFFFTRRWRDLDTSRSLAALDKRLHLDERVTTAWELLRRAETKAVAALVLRQADAGLRSLEPRELFPRTWSWHGYFIVPLLGLWLALLWFDGGPKADAVGPGAPSALSQKLREFARQLQQKAQSEGLPQALKTGRELEKLAQRGIDAKSPDEQLKTELQGMARKMASQRSTAGDAPFAAAESRQDLEDLRAEIEGARDLLNPSGGATQPWQDQLDGLTQLQKQLGSHDQGTHGQSREQLKTFLDKLEKQVTGELDRRALLEAEQYLQQLAQRGQSQQGETQAQVGGKEEGTAQEGAQREKNAGSAPGEEPGTDLDKPPSLPEFRGGAQARVKGTIGTGERSGVFFQAKPSPNKSRLSQDEVIASYRRQAEAELDTERIPDELKDTIKNYFLSLEKAQ